MFGTIASVVGKTACLPATLVLDSTVTPFTDADELLTEKLLDSIKEDIEEA